MFGNHTMREGRSPQQIGRTGLSNHRWSVGGKLCLLLNQYGLIVAWACDTANGADNTFQWLIRQFEERMSVLMRHDSACCITTQVDGKSEDLPEVSRLT
jgi:hypothetical protein